MEHLGFWGLLMSSVEKSSDSGNLLTCSASTKNGDEESSTSSKQVLPLKGSGSRNTRASWQKVVKTRPRGFEEETVASFGKPVVADVQMEDGIWAMLPEDLLNESLARVPPFYDIPNQVVSFAFRVSMVNFQNFSMQSSDAELEDSTKYAL